MPSLRLIAGSGRSGTTWIQDALASANGLRPVFEPMHPWQSEIGARYAHRALTASDDRPDLQRYLQDVCAGRRNRLWTQYRRHRHWLVPPVRRLTTKKGLGRFYRHWLKFLAEAPELAAAARRSEPLVKCIRINLMLGWIEKRMDCATVFVIRHPGAVIESEMRGEWNADDVLNRYRADDRLHAVTGDRYRPLLARRLAPVEGLAARWVIENQCALEYAEASGMTVVHYENLLSDPQREWPRIVRALDLPNLPTAEVLARPSQQSSVRRSASEEAPTREPRWMRSLGAEHGALIQGILDDVGFGAYSMSDALPQEGRALAGLGRVVGLAR